MPAQEEREITSRIVWTDKCEQMYSSMLAETHSCQWLLSSYDSWKEMNAPQNHHGNCHYPVLAASAVRSGMGKTSTRLPSQVEAEASQQGSWKTSTNGGAPQKVWCLNGIFLDCSFSHVESIWWFLLFSFFSPHGYVSALFLQALVLMLTGISDSSEHFFPQLPPLQTRAAKQVFLPLESLCFWGKDLYMYLLLCVFWKVRRGLSSFLADPCIMCYCYWFLSLPRNAGGTLLWTEGWGWITQGAIHRVLSCLSVCVKFLCSHEQSSGKGTINKSMFSSSLALVYAGSLGVSYNLGHPNKTWDVYQHNFFSISGWWTVVAF